VLFRKRFRTGNADQCPTHGDGMEQIWEDEVSSWKFRNLERDTFLEIVKTLHGKILEVGPGYGRILNAIEDKDVTGLEISENLAKRLRNENPTANIVVGNIEKTDFESGTFDAVIMEEVIEHIADQEKVFKEIFRLLKIGGKLVLSTPNKYVYRILMYANNIRKFNLSFELLKNPTPGHVAECTLKELRNLLNGYEIEKIVAMNPYVPSSVMNAYNWLAIGFIIVATKKF
jgi:SAM-dependent methyltransferase